jgi:PAS domain S-box-containing protein
MDIRTLEKAKQQWQSAADLMPQLICLMDNEGRLLRINRTMEWWGLGGVASARGRGLHDILHPGCTDPDCYFQRFWHDTSPARLEGRRTECEVFDPLLDRHFAIRVQPLVWRPSQTHEAEDLHTVVVVDDISDLKQAEAGIQRRQEELSQQVAHEVERRALSEEMQARLLTILDKTTDYIAMTDASESMLYLNPAGRTMLGLGPADDISGKKLCDHADPDVQHTLRHVAIPTAIEEGLWAGESRMRDSNGQEIHTSQVIIAHRDGDGQVDCISTILRDIGERVMTEQALRESREELRQLSGLLVSIQEDERRRISLDLHDGLGQSLSLIKLAVENAVEQMVAGNDGASIDTLRRVIPRLKDALIEVRRVSTELRPSILDDLGILPTLTWFFREFEAVCGEMTIEKHLDVSEHDVPAPLKITIYRILQEATSNIVKHSGANRIRVSLHRDDDALHLSVQDNGHGFDPKQVCAQCGGCDTGVCRGIGLVSMKERVGLSGGSYHLESSPGFGTTIQASWPLS